MKLNEILRDVPVVSQQGNQSVEITSVTSDSRQTKPGALFVAVPGFNTDGATFISSAVEKGAAAVVSENATDIAVPRVRVDDARAALATIAANFYGRPANRLSLIGITGTSGKTTTTKMVESILDATGAPVGLIGTIEYRAGSVREVADRTTPDAAVLQEWFARMVSEGVTHAVMEVSSHALALKRTYGVPFAAAAFTNLSRDHFDFHKDEESYFAAKRTLFDQIDRSKRTAVINIDDPHGQRIAKDLGNAVLSFGQSGDIRPAAGFRITVEGLFGELETPSGRIGVESSLLGTPNLYNWMAAVGVTQAVGISRDVMEVGISKVKSVRGRFERVSTPDGSTILVDYAHKPDALEKLLRAVRDLAPGKRIILVFGCGGDRDKGKRPLMGEIAGRMADLTIITSDNPRNEDPMRIIREIEAGLKKVPSPRYQVIADRREAIGRAVSMAGMDSVVVIAGKGHENYQVIGDRIVHFDDREEVEQALSMSRTKAMH